MKTGVSVVVCCYNSAARITQTLNHLAQQQTPATLAWEIVLIDNHSSDQTGEIARQAWERCSRADVPFRIIAECRRGLVFAREKGIQEAEYSVIIFCDDDNWLHKNYVFNAFTILDKNPEIGALGGTGIPVTDTRLPEWFERYKYSFACYPQGESDGELSAPHASLYGAGLSLRREVLTKLYTKNYKPVLTDRIGDKLIAGGDTELCYAIRLIGYKLWFSNELQFYHYLPSSRLSETYLIKLNAALSFSRATLLIYMYALSGKSVSGYTWYKDMLYQVTFFCRSLLRCMNLGHSPFERKLAFDFSFYSMRSILQQFGKYETRYQRILKLKE